MKGFGARTRHRSGFTKCKDSVKRCATGYSKGPGPHYSPTTVFQLPQRTLVRLTSGTCSHFCTLLSRLQSVRRRPRAGNTGVNMPWIDIGANLLDGMYAGQYGGSSPRHPRDLDQVLERAWGASVAAIIITAGTKEESRKALDLACTDSRLYSTVPASEEVPHGYCVGHHADPVGVHPTRCSELIPHGDVTHGEAYIDSSLDLCREGQRLGKVVAIGECGLDYDRLRFCDKEKQLSGFKLHFRLADATGLPMFLHNRNTGTDFMDILRENRSSFRQGVVHSFTGGPEEAAAIIDQDCYIGVNGCSLKTEEQLSTLRTIPLERILLETDAPWCEIRSTHAGAGFVKTTWPTVKKEKWEASKCVKGRQEPCHIRAVAEIVAAVLQLPLEEVEKVTYENTRTVFGNLDRDT